LYGSERQERVFINEHAGARSPSLRGDVGSYRQYVINHEVGHAIGYLRHEPCDKPGGLAPVMMQQTFSTSNDDAAKFDPEYVKGEWEDLPIQSLAIIRSLDPGPQ